MSGDTLDRYRGSDGQWHARFRLGPNDETPDYTGRSSVSCGGCYSGNAHSQAYHTKRVEMDSRREPSTGAA